MTDKLPVKLAKEPLIEGLFEFRFVPNVPFAEIAPGWLHSTLEGALKLDRLPAAEVPKPIRDSEPSLRYTPLIRIDLDRFRISIGDRVLSVSCKLPYPGWNSGFKEKILEVVNSISTMNIIQSVERHSIKYVNIIGGLDLSDQASKLTISLSVGNRNLESGSFQLRTDWFEADHTNIVTVTSSAEVEMSDGERRSGILLDIDTIRNFNNLEFKEWAQIIPEIIDSTRLENKRIFFECLKKETVEELEPTYG